jgi:hypothetical protein
VVEVTLSTATLRGALGTERVRVVRLRVKAAEKPTALMAHTLTV